MWGMLSFIWCPICRSDARPDARSFRDTSDERASGPVHERAGARVDDLKMRLMQIGCTFICRVRWHTLYWPVAAFYKTGRPSVARGSFSPVPNLGFSCTGMNRALLQPSSRHALRQTPQTSPGRKSTQSNPNVAAFEGGSPAERARSGAQFPLSRPGPALVYRLTRARYLRVPGPGARTAEFDHR